jgi:carboxylesterase type B
LQVYVFSNIPFAKPPTGNRRFQKPVTPPDKVEGVQNGTVGRTCVEIMPKYGLNFFGDAAFTPLGPVLNGILGNLASGMFVGGEEDCLFLDVYVPGRLMRDRSARKVAVVNWITGGAVS